jgi:hypothetical protein
VADGCPPLGVPSAASGVTPDGYGWLFCVDTGGSARRWSAIKSKLSFCGLTQDGDDEGCLHLDHLPMADEAETIRDALGIPKRCSMTSEAMAKARSTR